MTRTRLTLIASVLVLATVLTGCGSSELTATEFRTKVNAMCAKAKVDTEKVGKTLTSTSTEADIKKAIGQAVDRDRKLADDIDALNPPTNLAAMWTRCSRACAARSPRWPRPVWPSSVRCRTRSRTRTRRPRPSAWTPAPRADGRATARVGRLQFLG